MSNIVLSERQREVLKHLRASDGMTMPALGVLFGPAARKAIRRLLSRGLVKISETGGTRLILAGGTPAPKTEESFHRRVALGWLYARAVQAGCRWQAGTFPEVIFPNGARYRIAWRGKTGGEKGAFIAILPGDMKKPRDLPAGSIFVITDSLRKKSLREALTKYS